MADDQELQMPQETYSGGTPVMSKVDPDGNEFIVDQTTGKYVFVGKRDWQARPSAADATAELARNLRKIMPEAPPDKIVQLNPSPPLDKDVPRGTDSVEPPPPSPLEQAAATKTLTDQMRQEEAALMTPQRAPATPQAIVPPATQTGTQPPPMDAPIAPPQGANGQQPIAPPQIDPAERQRLMEQRPTPGTRTPPPGAAIQFYNMQAYQRAIQMGMPQKQAASIYLPGMLQGQAAAPKPNWVPADPNTGAPGHFETSKGTIHVPTQPKPSPVIKATGKLSEVEHAELTSGLSELNADERDARKALTAARAAQDYEAAGKALDELKKIQADRKKLIGKFSAKVEPPTGQSISKPANQGKPVKDKNGKTWLYTGTAADPRTDRDPSHWTAQ